MFHKNGRLRITCFGLFRLEFQWWIVIRDIIRRVTPTNWTKYLILYKIRFYSKYNTASYKWFFWTDYAYTSCSTAFILKTVEYFLRNVFKYFCPKQTLYTSNIQNTSTQNGIGPVFLKKGKWTDLTRAANIFSLNANNPVQ